MSWLLKTSKSFPVVLIALMMVLNRYSQINQQIALKTIKKFGFSVNAVWNGKEALDYLLEPESATHPKPDIILMDVQMPILDGYKATHMIRHHSPYANSASIRTLPIVAMTASAIQGDKEKTARAGMDDYLAKPVRGKTLESMLLKWAPKGKNEDRRTQQQQHIRIHDDTSCASTDVGSGPSLPASETHEPTTTTTTNNSKNISSSPTPLPGAETEGDRVTQRVEAEEKATSLRDNKLLATASEANNNSYQMTTPPNGSSSHRPPDAAPPPAALTRENVGRLDWEHGQELSNNHNAVGESSADRVNDFLRPTPAAPAIVRDDEDQDGENEQEEEEEAADSLAAVHSQDGSGGAVGVGVEGLEASFRMRGGLVRGESERTLTLGSSGKGG